MIPLGENTGPLDRQKRDESRTRKVWIPIGPLFDSITQSNSSKVSSINNRDSHFDRHSFHGRDTRLIVDNFHFIRRITPKNNSHGVLVQDGNKCQDRDEHSPVPGRLIARDSSRKGLSPPARLKNDVRQQQVRIPFLRVPPFFR